MNEFGIDQDTVNGFLDEAGKHVATLNERLLGVEQGQTGPEIVAEMFRAAHSLKGAAGFLKLNDIATVTHRMESVLDAVRHGKLDFSAPIVEALFESFDTVSSLLAGVAGGGSSGIDIAPVQARLEAALHQTHAAPRAATAPPPPPPPTAAPASAEDPFERHLGRLPDWLRGHLDEEDACEALVASASGEHVVVVRFAAGDLLGFSRGPSAGMQTLAGAMRVRRIIQVVSGPEDLWAPLKEYRLDFAVFGFLAGDPGQVLGALEIPPGEAQLFNPGQVASAPFRVGRDPAAAGIPHDRLVIKPEMERHRALWLATTRDTLAELDGGLLSLEQQGDDQPSIDAVFRHLHSIKGACASMGLIEMARLAHQGESLLAAVRDGRLRLDAEAIADLFATKDALQTCLDKVEARDEVSPDTAALDASLRQRLVGVAANQPSLPAWTPNEVELASARTAADGRQLWRLRLLLTSSAPLADLRYGVVLTNLGRVATVVASRPTLAELERGLPDPPPLCVLFASSAALKELIDVVSIDHVRDWSIDPIAAGDERQAANAGRAAVGPATAAASDTVRVDTARLDHLLNTAGELVITKARLTQQIDQVGRLLRGIDLRLLELAAAALPPAQAARSTAAIAALRQAQDESGRARDTTLELHRHTSAMQNSVMQARMVPIGPLFQRFHRLIRDLCKERGREAKLVTAGEATELDKKLIDEIGDPLTHLLRNGVDHGLESPDDRQAAGKPRQGTVHLEAFHRSGMVCIQVRDDGRGLVVDRIRAKAVERGLIDAEAAARLPPHEVFQFIFLPGFSTAAQVTNISGRGVGMDIVKSKVTALKGRIDIESEPGRGATFTISLPLTLAMIDSLLVRIGGARYAFPLECVREIVEVRDDEVRSVEGRGRVIYLREQAISLIDLGRAMGIQPAATGGGTIRAVITKGGSETMAIIVDQVLSDEEIVVKPLSDDFRGVRGLSGATVLGDGGVALILDIHGIHELSRGPRKAVRSTGA